MARKKKKNRVQLNPRKKKKKSKTPYNIDQTKKIQEREKRRNNRHMRKRGGFII